METELKPGSSVSLDNFNLLTVIGKGSYAKVVLVKKKGSDKIYALKILKKKHIEKKRQENHIMTERDVLVEVKHPFVISMYASFQNEKKLFFVLEYCPGGELFGLLSKRQKFSEEQSKFYAAQMFLAIQYLHSKDIIYRDLKPQNVLIDTQGYLRLTDFGLSKMHVEASEALSICGTPQYLAPQIILKQGHGKPVDWWCLGSIIYEMMTGLPPFYSKSKNELFQKIKTQKPNLSQFSSKLRNLLEGLFQKDPNQRLGTQDRSQIRNHPWFQKINWESLLRKEIKAPFVPNIKSELDVSYFDHEFTQCDVESYNDTLKNSDQEPDKPYIGFSYDNDKDASPRRLMEIQTEEVGGEFQLREQDSDSD